MLTPRTTRRSLGLLLASALISTASLAQSYEILEYNSDPVASERTGSSNAAGRAIRGALPGVDEVEPNGTSGTATPLAGTQVRVRGNVFPAADQDVYSFTAAAGDRVYAATQTLWDASNSGDSVLELLASDGTTLIEADNNDGTFNANASNIAGAVIPSAGTYFLRVRHNTATGTIRPYDLHFRLQSGAPIAETEANNTPATANPLPASGWVSGTVTAVSPGESDFYSLTLNAGDSVFLALDMNPERDASVWNGRLGFGLFGNPPAGQLLLANDTNAGATATDPNSEAFFFTVKDAGTYFIYVDSIVAAGLGANATYHLSASVYPAAAPAGVCTTHTSADTPLAIPSGPGQVSSTINVPGNPRIADINVAINLNHTFMQDMDAHLVSPAGNDNGLFTDIGSATVGGAQTLMDIVLDDEAALPPAFALSAPLRMQPELAYRLSWFDGSDGGGNWSLVLRDDATGDGGTLNSWSITICEPPPPPSCPAGFAETTVYSTDFETDDAGFTHSGVTDEWERGLPSFAPITTCNGGSNCFKTDLDNTYNAGVATGTPQDLLSPNINLAGLSPPVRVRWAQRYQIESASFDRAFVDIQQVGGGSPQRLWEWRDATMTSTVGNPTVTIAESSGWSQILAQADSFAGQNVELRFNLTSDNTVQLAGLAIDDVSITACRALTADLAITKTNGTANSVPGGNTTYTITASNAGPDPVTGATVADTFPAVLTCSWTCVGAGGGTCTAAGSGNINDPVNLPTGGSVTYTASCAISAAATGNLVNTATVASAITDPTPGNNSATDTDTLVPAADLAVTKTNGVASSVPGGSTTYTIVASNAGPSNAPAATVADTFPAALTCTWTCVGAGGGTCTAAGSGNINDPVNLPAGGSVTYTASCAISAAATGNLVNTATVASAINDPTPGNNSATDTDTLTPQADLSITKTDGVATVTPGGSTTYTIVASNAGPSHAPGSTVADTAPAACTSFTWTCTGAGGGTCTANGSGSINDVANLPAAGSVTYSAVCAISGSAVGTLVNTATVTAAGGITDPTPGNNSATDTNTIAPPGVLTATPGSFDFGTVAIGVTSPATTITLGNTGGSPLTVSTLTSATAPFALTGGTCGAPPIVIANGGSCTLTYTFTPAAAGGFSQNFSADAGAGGTANFTLNGSGGQGVVGVLSANLNFGNQNVGANTQQVLTITNTGSGPISVTGLSAVTAPFSQIAGGTCGALPFTLLAGESCTVLYRFSPTVAGLFSQIVTVTADVGTVDVTLTGRGLLAIALPLGSTSALVLLGLVIAGAFVVLRRRG